MAAQGTTKSQKKDKSRAPKGPPVTDPRFEAVQWDPRFQRFPKANRHVEIDKRFEGMFKNPEFQQHSTVDKRGRKVEKRKNQENMRKYYKLRDQDARTEDAGASTSLPSEAQQSGDASKALPSTALKDSTQGPATNQGHKAAGSNAEVQSEEEEQEESAEDIAEQRWAQARGLIAGGSSSDEEEDSAAAVSDEEEALEQEWGVGAMAANPDEHIPDSDETQRLAIVDLDWDKIRAVDILAVLRSFLAKGQSIKAVTVYPSDFGLEKMKEEAAIGPQSIFGRGAAVNGINGTNKGSRVLANAVGLSESDSEAGQSDEGGADADAHELLAAADDGSSEEEDLDDEQLEQDEASDSDSGNEVDQRRLQLYERSRLRYYYAVVDCQDVRTAAHLYAECDGIEFLRSACKLDMRFVPETQSFAQRQVRDTAREVPADYAPPDFTTAALQHTNVKLTWDADDDSRKKALRKKMTEDSIRDDDFKAYLASSSEEEEIGTGDAAALRERYRALLLANSNGDNARTGGPKGRAWGGGGDPNTEALEASDSDAAEGDSGNAKGEGGRKGSSGRGTDMEVSFTPGLEGLGARLLAQKKQASQRKGDTVWEAYLRRQKEKKLAAKAQGRRHASSDEDDSEEEAAEADEAGSAGEQDPFFQHEDNPFDDPFFRESEGGAEAPQAPLQTGKASKKATGKAGAGHKAGAGPGAGAAAAKADRAAEQQRQAELELLMMDDSALQDVARVGGKPAAAAAEAEEGPMSKKGKQKVSRKERIQRRRDQKRAERQAGSDDEDLGQGKVFEANLQDPRFKSLFTSADYALDPTDPRFQQADGSSTIAKAVSKQRQQHTANPLASTEKLLTSNGSQVPNAVQQHDGVTPGAADAAQLKSMIASLKRKASKTANVLAKTSKQVKKKQKQRVT